MPAVRCPDCRGDVSVDPSDYGYLVACPLCGVRFTPHAPEPGLTPEGDEAGSYPVFDDDRNLERPSRRRSRYSDDDDVDRPSRRRREPVDWDEAERLVAGAATALILTGWIGAVLSLFGGIGLLIGGIAAIDAADPDLKENGPVFLVYGALLALFGTPYCIVMAVGGQKMKKLSSMAWAYTAAVLGILTIVLCGPCLPLTWAAMPIGIWAIVVLGNTAVKNAFEANRGH